MSDSKDNRALVEDFWRALAARDFDACGDFFTADGHYTDVPAPEEGARGPAAIAARLELGLGPLERYVLRDGSIVADGDMVITEHEEEWYWGTGEQVVLPFVSVMEVRDGKLTRWWDYWDMQTLMNAAPEWWVEHIMQGYQ
jgi:limonene-1,2-epoxide hydrolase